LLNNKIIRSCCACLLVCLFAFSITPRKLVHDLIANHKDGGGKLVTGAGDQLSTSTYHCSTDDLVVESPFVFTEISVPVASVISFPPEFTSILPEHRSIGAMPAGFLRGPPAVA